MPPIKGKMMGRMGRSMQPSVSEFERAKNFIPKKKARMHLSSGSKMKSEMKEDNIAKLRYPPSIRQILPSVKRFKSAKNYMNTSDDSNSSHSDDSETGWDERAPSVILGTKKAFRGSGKPKYFLRATQEEKFKGMIWDVAFSPNGDIVVSSAEGLFICSVDLRVKQKLDTVVLAGGVSFMSDGRIVAICRNKDTVNIFTSDGEFLSSFPIGQSPMAVCVDKEDRLLVCDPGAKCVYICDDTGAIDMTIGPSGPGFNLRWPLYVNCHSDCGFLVADCHSQTVLLFTKDGKFLRDIKLATVGSNEVLRPHGLCIHKNDVFIIDNATDSVEVFTKHDTFVQTLIPQEEGHTLRPKVVSVTDKYLVVGGLSGIVKVYKFMAEEELDIKPHHKTIKPPSKKKSTGRPKTLPKLKIEIKDEVILSEVSPNGLDVSDAFAPEKYDEVKDEIKDGDYDTLVSDTLESQPPKLLNTEDDPVVLDSESEEDSDAEEASFVFEHVSENVCLMSDGMEAEDEKIEKIEIEDGDDIEDCEEDKSEPRETEKLHIDEVIILDDE